MIVRTPRYQIGLLKLSNASLERLSVTCRPIIYTVQLSDSGCKNKCYVKLCYRDIVVCIAYVNLNLDVNTIFSALDRTNRRFYKRESLFICMAPQPTRPCCSTMDSCS